MVRCGVRLALSLCACAWLWTAEAMAQADGARVLVLNSYHPQYAWTEELVRGVRDEFKDVLPDENLHIEFMDARRMVSDPAYLGLLSELYARKYARFHPDVIISSDDSALNFLLAERDRLFPGVPVVFCGINSSSVQELEPVPNMTGILEGLEVEGNLSLIKRLHPDATRIVLLSDRTPLGEGMKKVAREVVPRFATPALAIEIWDDFTLAELNQRVRALDQKSIVLLLAIHEDRAGHYFSFTEHLRPLTEASRVPIYGMFGMLLGQGVTGGMMNDAYEHGRATAAMARRVLAGTPADAIPIVASADYRPRFDYALLTRFGIGEGRLPGKSFVLNRPLSFYSLNTRLVWSALAVIIGLLVAVGWLARLVQRMRTAERELIDSQAELRRAQRLELIGRLAGGIAHDFNNLLVPIITCADLIEVRLGPHMEKARMELETLRLASSRAADLSRQLLGLSRPQPLSKDFVDVTATVRQLESMLRRTVSEGATLHVTLPEQALFIKADRTRIEQVLVNLVVNANDAILATPARAGEIWLSVEVVTLSEASPKLDLPAGSYACLTVRDDGVGMHEEVLEKIFVPFFSTKAPGRGTGLGLATVQSVAAQHQGAVKVESNPGRGTTLRVLIPLVPGAGATVALAPARVGTRTRTARILVVEDDPLVRAVTTEGLKTAGHTVRSVDDPLSVLAQLAREPGGYDLLLTDLLMPGLNGHELWEQVRAVYPDMRVLFMSGYDAGLLESRGATPGDHPFLRKPFSIQSLCERVQDVLEHA